MFIPSIDYPLLISIFALFVSVIAAYISKIQANEVKVSNRIVIYERFEKIDSAASEIRNEWLHAFFEVDAKIVLKISTLVQDIQVVGSKKLIRQAIIVKKNLVRLFMFQEELKRKGIFNKESIKGRNDGDILALTNKSMTEFHKAIRAEASIRNSVYNHKTHNLSDDENGFILMMSIFEQFGRKTENASQKEVAYEVEIDRLSQLISDRFNILDIKIKK